MTTYKRNNSGQLLTAEYTIASAYINGYITKHEAAQEFCKLGWTNYVNEVEAIRIIHATIKRAADMGIVLSTLTSL